MQTNQKIELPKIIAVVGPTASGKTALGIALAKKYNGEIISADSRQIYRGMDIGTAKASIETRDERQETGPSSVSRVPRLMSRGIPHHLIDIKNPDENYTVAEYKRDAESAIKDILKRNKLPIIVGGTGLYVQAALENLDIPEIEADLELRARIETDIQEKGLAVVFDELVALDPEAAYVVDPKNPRRVVRALEVALITGKPFTGQRKKSARIFDALKLGVHILPEVLRERIDGRVDLFMQNCLAREVDALIAKYGTNCIAFDAIGYREIIDSLKGKISIEKAIEEIKLNTWHYAKRQMTWFRRDKEIHWIESEKEAKKLVDDFL